MSSTFTLPLRLNTRQIPSNDGTLSADNTGAATISQQVTVATDEDATIVIPAGSIVHFVQFYATTTGTSRDITLDSTAFGSVATTAAVNSATITDAALAANVGPANATLVVEAGSDGSAGVVSVIYTGRNADGTIAPYGSGYTNN
jgi:hypothetical protein